MDVRCNNIHSNMVFVNKRKISVRVRVVTFQNTKIVATLLWPSVGVKPNTWEK